MSKPGMPDTDPVQGGNVPSEVPPNPTPDELPDIGPSGPRTPYPVNDPGIADPRSGLGARLSSREFRPTRHPVLDCQISIMA